MLILLKYITYAIVLIILAWVIPFTILIVADTYIEKFINKVKYKKIRRLAKVLYFIFTIIISVGMLLYPLVPTDVKTTYTVEEYKLKSIEDNISYLIKFKRHDGDVSQELKYYYCIDFGNYSKQYTANHNLSKIYEDDCNEYKVAIKSKKETWTKWFYFIRDLFFDKDEHAFIIDDSITEKEIEYKFFIPKNSVKVDYNIDNK